MSLPDRLGLAGVVLGFLAIAAPYLWPDKKWIGWISLSAAIVLIVTWAWLETRPRLSAFYQSYPIRSTFAVFVGGGFLAVSIWLLIMRGTPTTPPVAAAPSPGEAQKDVRPKPPKPAKSKKQLGPLTDGQRFALQKKLVTYAGRSVGLIRVGSEPSTEIVFQQLMTIFSESNWNVQPLRITTVTVGGVNFPNNPYLTSENVASETAKGVFSIFASVGINLPLVPDAFDGLAGRGTPPDVVIVIH